MVAVLSMAAGFRTVVTGQARDDVAVVLRSGATGASDSILNHQDIQVLWEAPGVARGPDGPLVSPELFVIIDRKKIGAGTDANVPLRGVEAAGFALREQFEIVEGRNFEPGRNEVIVATGRPAPSRACWSATGSTWAALPGKWWGGSPRAAGWPNRRSGPTTASSSRCISVVIRGTSPWCA